MILGKSTIYFRFVSLSIAPHELKALVPSNEYGVESIAVVRDRVNVQNIANCRSSIEEITSRNVATNSIAHGAQHTTHSAQFVTTSDLDCDSFAIVHEHG